MIRSKFSLLPVVLTGSLIATPLIAWAASPDAYMIKTGWLWPTSLACPAGPEVTRTLAWSGGDRLNLSIHGEARHINGPAAKVVVTGPACAVDHVVVVNGAIKYDQNYFNAPAVKIVVTAPGISRFGVSGSGRLTTDKLAQDHADMEVSGSGRLTTSGLLQALRVSVSGSGAVVATGSARTADIGISGSGHADLGGLSVGDVSASISGSGSAVMAPTQSADLRISGSGNMRLLTSPARMTSKVSGSGHVTRAGA